MFNFWQLKKSYLIFLKELDQKTICFKANISINLRHRIIIRDIIREASIEFISLFDKECIKRIEDIKDCDISSWPSQEIEISTPFLRGRDVFFNGLKKFPELININTGLPKKDLHPCIDDTLKEWVIPVNIEWDYSTLSAKSYYHSFELKELFAIPIFDIISKLDRHYKKNKTLENFILPADINNKISKDGVKIYNTFNDVYGNIGFHNRYADVILDLNFYPYFFEKLNFK